MITILFNNQPIVFESNPSLLEALKQYADIAHCYSVVLNRHFIPRVNYANTFLNEGDTVEMIMPMQGG